VEFISLQHECGGGLIKPIATVKTIQDRIAINKIFFACRKRVDTTLQNGAETNSTNGLIKRKEYYLFDYTFDGCFQYLFRQHFVNSFHLIHNQNRSKK
jgi:hypothetical protein